MFIILKKVFFPRKKIFLQPWPSLNQGFLYKEKKFFYVKEKTQTNGLKLGKVLKKRKKVFEKTIFMRIENSTESGIYKSESKVLIEIQILFKFRGGNSLRPCHFKHLHRSDFRGAKKGFCTRSWNWRKLSWVGHRLLTLSKSELINPGLACLQVALKFDRKHFSCTRQHFYPETH